MFKRIIIAVLAVVLFLSIAGIVTAARNHDFEGLLMTGPQTEGRCFNGTVLAVDKDGNKTKVSFTNGQETPWFKGAPEIEAKTNKVIVIRKEGENWRVDWVGPLDSTLIIGNQGRSTYHERPGTTYGQRVK